MFDQSFWIFILQGDESNVQGDFFTGTPPLKVLITEKFIKARLGVSRTIYVNLDSPLLGFPYFNFLGGYQ